MHEWRVTDTLIVGLFFIAFSERIASLVVKLWRHIHEPSLARFNAWLAKR